VTAAQDLWVYPGQDPAGDGWSPEPAAEPVPDDGSQNHGPGSGSGSENQPLVPGAGSQNHAVVLAVVPEPRPRFPEPAGFLASRWAWFWRGRPDSLEDVWSYRISRVWLEDYMSGWVRAFCEWENALWLIFIGTPLTALGNCLSRAGSRQARFWKVTGVLLAIYLMRKITH
jgi:hypothetical protein